MQFINVYNGVSLHVSDNKTELSLFLAKELQAIDIEGKEVYTTYGEVVLSSQPTEMMECSNEEADTRLILHAYHTSQSGYHKILIRTVQVWAEIGHPILRTNFRRVVPLYANTFTYGFLVYA